MKTIESIEGTPAQKRALRREKVLKRKGKIKGGVKTEVIDAALRSLSERGGSNGSF